MLPEPGQSDATDAAQARDRPLEGEDAPAPSPYRVLVVCTANRGRSPMVAALLRAAFADLEGGGGVDVASAGLCAYEIGKVGLGADDPVVELLAAEGIDISTHRVRALDPEMYREADLVIAMEPWQRKVLQTAFRDEKCVTLHDLARGDADGTVADTANLGSAALRDAYVEMRDAVEGAAELILRRSGMRAAGSR
jgi:protein-tyrosine-phosphatase